MTSTREYGIPNLVPKTGQTTSYTAGDDGALQKGRKTTPRYVDNGDGTISDRLSGLMWPKCPARMVTGTPGVFPNNQTQVARGTWANSTTYAVGDVARDTSTLNNWVCKVAHTTPALPSDWQPSTAYTTATVVRDPNTGLFWAAGGNFTSIASPPNWAINTAYLSGDYAKDAAGAGNYWQAATSHTSVSQPTTFTSGSSWSNGQFTISANNSHIYQAVGPQTALTWTDWAPGTNYVTGDYVNGPDNNAYQAALDHTSSSDFFADLANGDWSQLYNGPMDLYQLTNMLNWTDAGTDVFTAVELASFTWVDTGVSTPFALDRQAHTWNSAANIYTFSSERSVHPTYWQQIYFADTASNLVDTAGHAFTSMQAVIVTLNSEGYAGYTDWRWPNVLELGSLFEPVINGLNGLSSLFTINHAQSFGSSTTWTGNTATEMLAVVFSTNGAGPYSPQFKSNPFSLWPVRGGG